MLRAWRREWLAIGGSGLFVSVALVVACGSGSDDPEPFGAGKGGSDARRDGSSAGPDGGGVDIGASSPEAKAFCERTLGRLADAYEACCTGADRESTQYKQLHDFSRAFVAPCIVSLAKSLATGRLTHDAAQADICLADFEAAYSPSSCATLLQAEDPTPRPSCKAAFAGTVAAGGACAGAHECQDGLTCVGHSSSADGVCQTPPVVGEPCGTAPGATLVLDFKLGDHPTCADGARCDDYTNKCVQAKTSGESCTIDGECAHGLRCQAGQCGNLPRADVGGDCRDDDDCKPSAFCARPTQAATGACEAKRASGGQCTGTPLASSECLGRCAADAGAAGSCASMCGSP